MDTPLLIPPVQGADNAEQAARMQRRFREAFSQLGAGGRRRRRLVISAADRVLFLCLLVCLIAIGVGLDRLNPTVRPTLDHALREDLPRRPFPDCDSAWAAGVDNIPVGTAAYTRDQDGDGDGLACEPS